MTWRDVSFLAALADAVGERLLTDFYLTQLTARMARRGVN